MNYILLRPDVPSMLSLRVLSAILSTGSGEMQKGKGRENQQHFTYSDTVELLARAIAQPRTRVCGGERSFILGQTETMLVKTQTRNAV